MNGKSLSERDGTLKDWRNLFKDKPESTYKPQHEMLPLGD